MTSALNQDQWNKQDQENAQRLKGPIFVIGASGFVGANLYFSLARVRSDVYAVSSQTKNSWRLFHEKKKEKKLDCDITNLQSVNHVIQEFKPKTIFNLAAYGAYENQSNSNKIHAVNYLGVLNLIQALQKTGCNAFVQAGSSSEYGINCKGPQEDSALLPNSEYAVSKGAASLLIKYYGQIFNFPCAHLRLSSVYGPWEERGRLIPQLILNGLKADFPHFVDKKISRDFIYADDCTRAFVEAALTVCISEPGLSLNIGTGQKTTLEEVANHSKNIFSIPSDPQFGSMPNRKWDLSDWYSNPELAHQKMQWSHRIAFSEGLKFAADWEKAALESICFDLPVKKEKKISAIVACYRDHESIPIMHERLTQIFQKEEIDYEIIFVNDNSPTSDEMAICNLCRQDPHVIGISHSRNFGSQSAFLSGMEVAGGDAIVLMDGDLQDPPEIIPEFIKKWNEGFEVIYGIRVKRVAPLYMQVFYKIFYRIFKHLSDIHIPLDAGDFSLIDSKVVHQMISLPEKDVFLRGLRAWVGFKQTGVCYVRPERLFGKSTNNFLKNIWWAKKAIFSFSLKPLEYIQRISIFLFFASAVLSFYYLCHFFFQPPTSAPGITTIILLVLGLGGVQLFSISILGDYVGKVLEEVKNRPRFIRNSIFYKDEKITQKEAIFDFIKKNHTR